MPESFGLVLGGVFALLMAGVLAPVFIYWRTLFGPDE